MSFGFAAVCTLAGSTSGQRGGRQAEFPDEMRKLRT